MPLNEWVSCSHWLRSSGVDTHKWTEKMLKRLIILWIETLFWQLKRNKIMHFFITSSNPNYKEHFDVLHTSSNCNINNNNNNKNTCYILTGEFIHLKEKMYLAIQTLGTEAKNRIGNHKWNNLLTQIIHNLTT